MNKYLNENEDVKGGQAYERYDVHDDEIHPCDIDAYVCPVLSESCGKNIGHVGIKLLKVSGLPCHLKKPEIRSFNQVLAA